MKTKRLGNIANIQIGKTPSRKVPSYWGKGNYWVSIADMKGKVIVSTKEQITDLAVDKCNCKLIPKGTLLLSFKLSVGKVAFAGTDLYTNEAICGLKIIDTKKVFSDYLYYVLKSIRYTGRNAAKGITLNKKSLHALDIPLPEDPDDQKRIAKVLSKAEELIQQRKQTIALLDEYLKSVFLDMFGDGLKYDSKYIRNIVPNTRYALSSGPFGSDLTSKDYVKDGVIVLRGLNISNNKLDLDNVVFVSEEKAKKLERSLVRPFDVVVVAVGSSGKALMIPTSLNEAIMSQNFNKITPDQEQVNPVYLEYCFNSEIIQRQITKVLVNAGRTFLSLTNIKELKLPIPPKPLQDKFAAIVEKVEAVKRLYEQSLQKLEELYGSLSQKAFKGELNVSRVEIDEEEGKIFAEPNIVEPEEEEELPYTPVLLEKLIETTVGQSREKEQDIPETKPVHHILRWDDGWEKYNDEEIARMVKEIFSDADFNAEMLFDFLTNNLGLTVSYFTSKELKLEKKTENKRDFKQWLFDCIQGENKYLKLRQFYHDDYRSDKNLVIPADYIKTYNEKDSVERSGIYFNIEP